MAERPDGSRVALPAYPSPLRDADGRLIGAVNVLVDITERVQAEDALRSSADALQRSNGVKDEFLGLVSHELRTPVTTIFGNAQMLLERVGGSSSATSCAGCSRISPRTPTACLASSRTCSC